MLIKPPLLGIVCVPPSISPSWCGVAAHAERVTTKTTAPAEAIALFIDRCRIRGNMYLPFQPLAALTQNLKQVPRLRALRTLFAVLLAMIQIKRPFNAGNIRREPASAVSTSEVDRKWKRVISLPPLVARPLALLGRRAVAVWFGSQTLFQTKMFA